MTAELYVLMTVLVATLWLLSFIGIVKPRSALIAQVVVILYFLSRRDLEWGDTAAYLKHYNGQLGSAWIFEPGFEASTQFARQLGFSDRLYITSIHAFIVFNLAVFALRTAKEVEFPQFASALFPVLLCSFTFYFYTCEAMREGMAMSFTLCALTWVPRSMSNAGVLLSPFIHLSNLVTVASNVAWRLVSRYRGPLVLTAFATWTIMLALKHVDLVSLWLSEQSFYFSEYQTYGTLQTRLGLLLLATWALKTCFGGWKGMHPISRKLYSIFFLLSLICFVGSPFQELTRRMLMKPYFLMPILFLLVVSRWRSRKLLVSLVGVCFAYYFIFLVNYHSYFNLLNVNALFWGSR